MTDWGGKVAAWFAGVAAASATLAALVAQTAKQPLKGLMHGLFIFLVVVAGVSFVALLFTGPRALWSAWHTRRQTLQTGPARTSKSKSKSTVPPHRQGAMPSSLVQKPDQPRHSGHGTSTGDAMAGLEGPRSAYIAALSGFYEEFSSILDFFFSHEAGSAQDSGLRREPLAGPDFAETTLPKLRDCKSRLSSLLEVIDMRPDSLDAVAGDVHEKLVMPAYKLMQTEAAKALGSQWERRDQDRFGNTYHAAASKWPAYREALEESR